MSTVTGTGTAAEIFSSLNGSNASTSVTNNDAGSADRFLKLLVAQMRNQDPLNPMDNAQVTSQMAQINTVDGINRLNDTVAGLNTQFVQLQALQGASLLGRHVSVKGDSLAISGEGEAATGHGGFDLPSAADSVRLEVLNGAGQVVATQDLGARKAGRHTFEWAGGNAADSDDLRFRIVAQRGAATVNAQPLMYDRVLSVSAGGNQLQLELARSGSVDYSSVYAVR
ncbi:MAG: flagellar hook assembly protein FlgD [Rubrivivax sp.]|nr:flagellar hook assembly protein FlgD [Rubrivivax sp.]